MSWFDSSFSFAKTALSQAQKSIDKVLDIKEGDVQPEIGDFSGSGSAERTQKVSSTTPVASSAQAKKATPTPAQTTPSRPPLKSQLSSPSPSSSQQTLLSSTPKPTDKSKPSNATSTPGSKTSSFSSSTWGGVESFWGSTFSNTPPQSTTSSGKKQAGGPQASKSAESAQPATATATTTSAAKGTQSSNGKDGSYSLRGGKLDTPKMTSTPVASKVGGAGGNGSKPGEVVNKRQKNRNQAMAKTSAPVLADATTSAAPATPLRHDEQELKSQSPTAIISPPAPPTTSTPPLNPPLIPISAEAKADHGTKLGSPPILPDSNSVSETIPKEDKAGTGMEVVGDIPKSNDFAQTQKATNSRGSPTEGVDGPPTMLKGKCDSGSTVSTPVMEKSPHQAESDPTVTVTSSSEGAPDSPEDVVDKGGVAGAEGTLTTSKTEEELKEALAESAASPSPPAAENSDSIGTKTSPPPAKTEGEATSAQLVSTEAQPCQSPDAESAGDKTSKEVHGVEEGRQEIAKLGTSLGQESEELERVKKELLHAQHIVEVREKKMMSMSQQIVELMESTQAQQDELCVLREAGQDVTEMREEFAKRLGMSEKKLQAVIKERDSLKKQLTTFQNEQSQQKKVEGEELSRLLQEKEEQIKQLMDEGEKLSKQELQSNSIIKKLRQKERQNDQVMTAQRQQIEDLESKVKNLKDQLKKKDESEKKLQESFAQLNTIADHQVKEIASLKTDKEGLLEKVRSLQTNLDNSYKELADLQKANAVSQSAAEAAAVTAEKSKQEEVKIILDQQKAASQKDKEALIMQIEELRMSVSRSEQQLAWREDHMKQEVADVQKRLQEAEDRNQELTSTISQATKPLLRQIENLQSAHSAQSANWEKVETSLTQRLVDAQAQLNVVLEKERAATEKELTLRSRVAALETQLSNVRQEKSQLLATVELERAKLETLEESQHRESSKLEALRASYQKSLEELRKEKEMLERQLEYERVRLEAESRKVCLESQEKERLRSQLANSLSSIRRSVSRQSSSGSQGDTRERTSSLNHENNRPESTSEVPFLGSHSNVGSASALEHLQSLLKQKEGELANMQNLSSSLERSRAAMAEDLAKLSAQNESLHQQVEKIPFLQQQLQEVRGKHEAMLQMYGEKAEEAEELKLDIQDLKSMYRQQIDELMSRRR